MDSRAPAALVGSLGYLVAAVFWGMNIPLTAELLASFDPFWLTLCRYVVAATALGAAVALSLGPGRLRSPIPLARVAVLGGCVAGFLMLFTTGLMLTHPVTAAAVLAGSPVFVAIVSRVMTGARLAPGFVPATLLTLVGAGIAIAGREGAGRASLGGGEPMIVASIVFWTVYSILAQRWFVADVPQLRRTWLGAVGAIPWLVLAWLAARGVGWAGEPNLSPDARALAFLLATAILSTALSTVLWNVGVARLGVAAGSLWQNAVPVFAVLISLVFFGIVPTGAQVLGGAVVMGGVAYLQWRSLRAAVARPARAAG